LAVKNKKRRLFFALWPSVQVRESVVEAARPLVHEMDACAIAAKNFHITLHFIGSITDDVKDCVHQAARSVTFEPFDLSLDRFGFFGKAKIFWIAAQTMPAELKLLHKNLGAALSACDFQPDPRPYSPHVSLLRKVKTSAIDSPEFSINWHVDEFVLVESVSVPEGVDYKVIEKYPLQTR